MRSLVLDASPVVRLICHDRERADARDLVDQFEPDRALQAEALALACHLDHPFVDCLYLALARREAAALLTADQRLRRLADRVLP